MCWNILKWLNEKSWSSGPFQAVKLPTICNPIVTPQAPLAIEFPRILEWVAKKSLSEYFYVSIDSTEKAMAPHPRTLAWKTPWMEEPGRLQSMGSLKSRTRLSDFTFTFHFHALEKEMATHCSVLAWRIPGTGEPGGLPFMRSHRVGHDWSDLAAA